MHIKICKTAQKLSNIKMKVAYSSVIQHGKVWVLTKLFCSVLSVNWFYCRMVELTLQKYWPPKFSSVFRKAVEETNG